MFGLIIECFMRRTQALRRRGWSAIFFYRHERFFGGHTGTHRVEPPLQQISDRKGTIPRIMESVGANLVFAFVDSGLEGDCPWNYGGRAS